MILQINMGQNLIQKNIAQKLEADLKKLNVVVVSHIFSSGPGLDLETFLQNKAKSVLFIGHPFSFATQKSSFFRKYSNGKLKKEHKAFSLVLPDVFLYIKEIIYTLLWIMRYDEHVDLYIGCDVYSTFIGLLLKKFRKVKNVVLYTIDYVPNRFQNPILNGLYHFFDKECLKECKIIWNVSPAIEVAREKFKKLKRANYSPQITVPLGVWYDRIPKLKFSAKDKNSLIYMGHLIEKQGVDIMIKALPYLIKDIPSINLTIIGAGTHSDALKKIVKENKLDKFVNFVGYVENHKDVERMLAHATLGLAMYKPVPENYTYFADPGKLKNYLAAGLPVILTNVPPIAVELEKSKCALISEYNPKSLAKHILYLLGRKDILYEYSKRATSYAKDYDWNNIFKNALSVTLN